MEIWRCGQVVNQHRADSHSGVLEWELVSLFCPHWLHQVPPISQMGTLRPRLPSCRTEFWSGWATSKTLFFAPLSAFFFPGNIYEIPSVIINFSSTNAPSGWRTVWGLKQRPSSEIPLGKGFMKLRLPLIEGHFWGWEGIAIGAEEVFFWFWSNLHVIYELYNKIPTFHLERSLCFPFSLTAPS